MKPGNRLNKVFIDQVLSSTSNATMWVAATMMLPSAEYAQFALVMTVSQVCIGICRALFGEPLLIADSITGTSNSNDRRIRASNAVAPLVVISLLITIVCTLQKGPLFVAVIAGMVGVAAQDFLRYVAFTNKASNMALRSDAVWVAITFLLVAILPKTAASVYGAWTIGGAASALFVAVPIFGAARIGQPIVIGKALRVRLVTEYLLSTAYVHVMFLLIARKSVLESASLRAASTTLSLGVMSAFAVQTMTLADRTRLVKLGQKELLRLASKRSVTCFGMVFGLAVVFSWPARPITEAVLGAINKSAFPLILPLGFASALGSAMLCLTSVLKALGRPDRSLQVSSVVSALSLLSVEWMSSRGPLPIVRMLALVNLVGLGLAYRFVDEAIATRQSLQHASSP